MCPFYSCALCTDIWQCTVQHVVAYIRWNWLHHFINTRPGSHMDKEKSHLEWQKEAYVEWHTNCYTGTLKTMIDLTLRQTQPYNIGACTHMKENILSRGGGGEEVRNEWHPDRDSYLKEHFGWNRNLEQSQLKCELSSRKGIKGEKDKEMEGKKWHGGEKKKKSNPTRAASWRCLCCWCKKNKSVPNGPQQPFSIMY